MNCTKATEAKVEHKAFGLAKESFANSCYKTTAAQ